MLRMLGVDVQLKPAVKIETQYNSRDGKETLCLYGKQKWKEKAWIMETDGDGFLLLKRSVKFSG
jgi:hypothetical protein